MTSLHHTLLAGPFIAAGMLAAQPAAAAPLPGGASSLVETYDDWSVVCQMQANVTSCVVRQVQTNNQTNQTVLTAEIGKGVDGKYQGALLLPLGLALSQGAQLKLDDAAIGAAIAFSMCVPQGCLAPLAFEADTVAKLRTGKTLTVTVSPANPLKPLTFNISLKGLTGALNRIADLTK